MATAVLGAAGCDAQKGVASAPPEPTLTEAAQPDEPFELIPWASRQTHPLTWRWLSGLGFDDPATLRFAESGSARWQHLPSRSSPSLPSWAPLQRSVSRQPRPDRAPTAPDPAVTVALDSLYAERLTVGDAELRVRARWIGGERDVEGTQWVDLLGADGESVASYEIGTVGYARNVLWAWAWDGDQAFRDLNADGVDDFGVVIQSYKGPYVEVWVSGPTGTHVPTVVLERPAVEAGSVVERWGPHTRPLPGFWGLTVYDFFEGSAPLYARMYGVMPDTLSAAGLPVLSRYDVQADFDPWGAEDVPLSRDALVSLSELPPLDLPEVDDPEGLVRWWYEDQTRYVRYASVLYTAVVSPLRLRGEPLPMSLPPYSEMATPRERARHAASFDRFR